MARAVSFALEHTDANMLNKAKPTGVERFFDKDDIIVSKTDLKGIITYGNRTFVGMSGYSEDELIGTSHNILRHEAMPRCVFKLLWDTVQQGQEIFAYVINKCKNGDHYWVFAHVTPSRNSQGQVVGYHSTRRVPNPEVVRTVIAPLYGNLLSIERNSSNPKQGMAESLAAMTNLLNEKAISYDELIFSLQR